MIKKPEKFVWYHVAITNDGKTASGYVNGEQVAKAEKSITFGNRFDLVISDPRDGGDRCFDGVIDEVLVCKAALTENDIKSIMNRGLKSALGISAVEPLDKLSTTWAAVKSQY